MDKEEEDEKLKKMGVVTPLGWWKAPR